MEHGVRELALFNLGIDSKLRDCDLVGLKVRDIYHGDLVASRAMVMQHKTQHPVQFEITPGTRGAVQKWIEHAGLKADDFAFPSRIHDSPHLANKPSTGAMILRSRSTWPPAASAHNRAPRLVTPPMATQSQPPSNSI